MEDDMGGSRVHRLHADPDVQEGPDRLRGCDAVAYPREHGRFVGVRLKMISYQLHTVGADESNAEEDQLDLLDLNEVSNRRNMVLGRETLKNELWWHGGSEVAGSKAATRDRGYCRDF
jgi:hypothetical protein